MADTTYVEFSFSDYVDAAALWQATEGVGLSAADAPERIKAYLARNPGMSFVARQDGLLVGAVLCGHDGRRGYLHHLAVLTGWRGRGIGSELARRGLDALASAGIDKCHLFVFRDNQSGAAFWRRVGWVDRDDILMMSKNIG